jgi:hypothetical protein
MERNVVADVDMFVNETETFNENKIKKELKS